MVREGDHHTLSSIALLQERFRQLQKMKEQRQERELLRMLSESERYSPPTVNNINYQFQSKQISGCSSEPMTFLPDPKAHCQLSLSLWPDSHMIKHEDRPVMMIGAQSNLAKSAWFSDAPLVCSTSFSKNIDQNYSAGSDIDTSLRL